MMVEPVGTLVGETSTKLESVVGAEGFETGLPCRNARERASARHSADPRGTRNYVF